MLDLMKRTNVRVGRGSPMGDDGIWLAPPRNDNPEATDRILSAQFIHWRNLFVKHLHLLCQKGAIME